MSHEHPTGDITAKQLAKAVLAVVNILQKRGDGTNAANSTTSTNDTQALAEAEKTLKGILNKGKSPLQLMEIAKRQAKDKK
jgi:hypothetical protein